MITLWWGDQIVARCFEPASIAREMWWRERDAKDEYRPIVRSEDLEARVCGKSQGVLMVATHLKHNKGYMVIWDSSENTPSDAPQGDLSDLAGNFDTKQGNTSAR